MPHLLSARILTGFIAVVLAAVMVCGLWMKSGLGTVPLLVVSALLVYASIVIACMLGMP